MGMTYEESEKINIGGVHWGGVSKESYRHVHNRHGRAAAGDRIVYDVNNLRFRHGRVLVVQGLTFITHFQGFRK